jgi:spermidine/putrescine transport system substrate-binding protein
MSTSKKSRLSLSVIFGFLAVFGSVAGCTKSHSSQPVVNLAIWGNYLSKQSEDRFLKTTGIKLHVLNYSSNEELLAKVQSGNSGIDVAVPSDYMIGIMRKMDLLLPLDKTKVPALKHLNAEVLNQDFDPGNKYSLPYAWTMGGIAVNRELYKDPITSWHDLFENPKLKGKFSVPDDVREVTSAVLKMQGHSANTTNPEELKLAEDFLLKIKKNVKMFTSDTVDVLKNKEVVAAQSYATDALQASAKTNGQIEFIIPKEGSLRYIDNLVIVKGAQNVEDAHRLIEFLLSLENDLEFVRTIRAGPVVNGVRGRLPADLKNSKILFPSREVMAKLEPLKDLGALNHLYEDIWSLVKSSE